ncbi:MAG: CHAT domain-containing protein, partial [Bacteroidota bacterium]
LGITTAKKSYDYVKKSGGEANFPLIKEITNVSQVYFDSGDYENAHYWAQQGDAFLDGQLSRAASQIDSIQVEFYRPTITHLEVRSLLKMTNQTSTAFIEEQLDKIDDAVAVLERRKTTTFSTDDINKLLIEYKSLNNLSKGLYHQLFTRTGETRFLDKTMAIQESGIYNRIRTQFNSRNNIRFGGIPQETLNREQQLKQTLKEALQPKEGEPISSYFDANEAWVLFLDSLKIQYPKYYKVRYATIEQPITNLQKNVPSETTVIRYLFINDGLYALVLTSTKKDLIFLSDELPADKISQLAETQGDLQLVAPIYHDLFQLLWKPIEQLVSTEKVIIIPDGALFNLSFETLTPTRIATFGDLATNSLLARHHISYNYSLLLLDESQKSVDYGNNFVAFAPEFSEQMKAAYSIAIVDSLELDKTYLTLLPQPFSIDMAEEYSRRFNGNSYLNENSTKQLFTANAREHKIIHIATHAESNNISPELSRLVFAKNLDDDASIADNYLYTFEIYNQNLSSNLAILTACETGKPTHQPGEGMISLAHAFNYAGSESILTSLWKVDEQSSNQIIGYFYENLESGMAKDEALRNAKLSYIANAGGRTAAPHYWAGLVLMGDPAPVPLSSGIPTWLWIVIGLVVIGLIFFFGSKRRS